MVNLGNTCYLNSVCQCLAQTLLARYFLSDAYISTIVNRFEGGGKIANTFTYVMRELAAAGVGYPVSPSPFKNAMGRVFENFSGGGQQDANEFLRCLLDGVHEDLNEKSSSKAAMADFDNSKGTDEELAKKYWNNYAARNASIVSNLFAFQERSVIECPQCGRVTRSFNAAMGVEVPVPSALLLAGGRQAVSIEDCLAQYCAMEVLDDKSLYKCSGCCKDVRAMKQMSFFSVPEVLVVSIKRFRSYGNFSDKVSTPVVFQPTLDMGPYVTAAAAAGGYNGSMLFKLVGVVNHQGNMHGGHYTADTLGVLDGHWASFSDEVIRPAQRPDFRLAYVLFYTRVTS
jgi:ubiquitin carboxyl-terminal hydrolase 2/21